MSRTSAASPRNATVALTPDSKVFSCTPTARSKFWNARLLALSALSANCLVAVTNWELNCSNMVRPRGYGSGADYEAHPTLPFVAVQHCRAGSFTWRKESADTER